MARRITRKAGGRLETLRAALEAGRDADAWTAARALLAGRPKDARTLSLCGAAAYKAGDPETALDLLGRAARAQPRDPEIRMNLANVFAGEGQTDESLAAYGEAHDLAPAYAEPAYNAGVSLARVGRHLQAAAWFEKALARDPDHGAATIGLAEAKRAAGDLAGARSILEGLIVRKPDDAVALTNLSAVLNAMGEDVAARDIAERAVAADPGLAAAEYNRGVAELALGDAEQAAGRFKRVLALEPRHAAAALNMGEALLQAHDADGARAAFARALDIDPGFAKAAVNLADLDLGAGNPDAALSRIERFLERHPGQPTALAFKALALRDRGDVDAALQLDDPDRFIVRREIAPPEGYADLADFNADIVAHLLAHPTLSPSPRAHATRAGRHSGELLAEPLGPMAAFADQVRAGFDVYRRRFVGEPSHPFLDRCPKDIDISVWGVVMDADGHQVPHIHPMAWLSGVYYAEVPESVRADDPGHAGWIEFGRAPDDIHVHAEPAVTLFKPEPGLMVLFPSHFYHRTVPLAGTARRVSIAFDVMPTAAA